MSTSLREFQIISKLGEGTYSSVFRVRRISDGHEYALKKVKMTNLTDKEKENALNEVRLLASIVDPYIIGYKEAFFDDASMALCIVMEYAGGGDILQKIQEHQKKGTSFSEKDIWRYLGHMVHGLRSLHALNILHRDLKCANVFVTTDSATVKLGDLNVSKVAKNNLVYTQTGTPYYASPEVWQDRPYGQKSDIWSLGCVLYEMIALKPPFRAPDMGQLFKKVQKGIYDKLPIKYSQALSNVIAACLKVNPNDRPTCDQLLMMPEVIKNCDLEKAPESHPPTASKVSLLNTIKVPRNLKATKLPKANYEAPHSETGGPTSKPSSFLPPIGGTPNPMKGKVVLTNGEIRAMRVQSGHEPSSNQVQAMKRYEPPKGIERIEALVAKPKGALDGVGVAVEPTRRDIPRDMPKDLPNYAQGRAGNNLVNISNIPTNIPKPQPPKPNDAKNPYDRFHEREDERKREIIARAQMNILGAGAGIPSAAADISPVPLRGSPVKNMQPVGNPSNPIIGVYQNKNMNYHENMHDYSSAIRPTRAQPSYKPIQPDWWG